MSTNPSDLLADPALEAAGIRSAPDIDAEFSDDWTDLPILEPASFGARAQPAAVVISPKGRAALNAAARRWAFGEEENTDARVLFRERKSDGARAILRNAGPIGALVNSTNGAITTGAKVGAFGLAASAMRYELRALPGRQDMALLVRVDPDGR